MSDFFNRIGQKQPLEGVYETWGDSGSIRTLLC